MNIKIALLNFLCFVFVILIGTNAKAQNTNLELEILQHGEMIRKAFSEGDFEKIKALHHPEVIKALAYNDLKEGRGEVMAGLKTTLESFNLDFVENNVESIFVQDSVAVEQTKFTIRGTPKDGGAPFLFKGRTMVTYVRYDKSPSGWATIREIIQLATE